MEHEEMSKLGFLQENSWETEESEKKFLFNSIQKMKKKAWEAAVAKQKQELAKEKANPQPEPKLPS